MKVTALALDPIEKKPLAHYKPGSMILSVGGLGCTMRCPWCQNHTIAQPEDPALVPVREMSIDELVEKARALVDEGNIGLAYTYNEPLVHWREVAECARRGHDVSHSRCQRRHGEARRGGDMAGEREPGHTPAPHALLSPVSLCRPPRNAPGDTPRGPGGHQQTPQRRSTGKRVGSS